MTSDKSSSPVHTGSCLCEAVKYTVVGRTSLAYLCHCRNCQKLTGTAFQANCFFLRSNFTVTEGADKLSVYHCNVTGSGNVTRRHFCTNCGSALFILPDSKPEIVVVMAGSMDDFDDFVPTQECFTKDRRRWIKEVEGAEMLEGARPANSGR